MYFFIIQKKSTSFSTLIGFFRIHKKIIVKNPEIPKNLLDEKLAILDIRAEINEDIMIDIEMHFIELPKFVQKISGTKSKLEQWLWVMVGKEDKMEKARKEN